MQFLTIGNALGISIPSLSGLGKILSIGILALISMEIIKAILKAKGEVGEGPTLKVVIVWDLSTMGYL